MKTIFLTLILALAAFTSNAAGWNTIYSVWNGYNNTGGTNINSGDTTNTVADYTSTSGNWDGTSVFTPTDGFNPVSSGVAAGRIAHVYSNGSTTNQYLALIMSVVNAANGAITLSTKSTNGFIPASGTGTVSIKVGGALAGPYNSGVDQFPFGPTVQGGINYGTFTNANGETPMLVFNGTWIPTNSIQVNNAGAKICGFTNGLFDGGFGHFFGTLALTGPVFNVNLGKLIEFKRLDIRTNAHAGTITNSGIYAGGSAGTIIISECKFSELWWSGVSIAGPRSMIFNNEFWHCNLANNSATGAVFSSVAGNQIISNFIHDNTGNNNCGAETDGAQIFMGNIVVNNNDGCRGTGDVLLTIWGNVIAFNARHGINFGGAVGVITDPMAVKVRGNLILGNGGVGITNTVASGGYFYGDINRNVFGAGSMANAGGDLDTRFKGVLVTNNISLASGAMPWAATNNYVLTNSTCKNGVPIVMLNESGMNYVTMTNWIDAGAIEPLGLSGGASFILAN